MIILRRKAFSLESKALWAMAPGAYQAKEAAKYAYDDKDYQKKKLNYAARGLFTPGTATYINQKVNKMAKEGKSKEEIRNYLEKSGVNNHVVAGLGEFGLNSLTSGITGAAAATYAQAKGAVDKLANNRASDMKIPLKKKHSSKKHDKKNRNK